MDGGDNGGGAGGGGDSGVWGKTKVGTLLQHRAAVSSVVASVADFAEAATIAEYLYGMDCEEAAVLRDIAANSVVVSSAVYEGLCARASQAFGMENTRWSVDDCLDETFRPLFRVSKSEFWQIYDALGVGGWACDRLANRSRVTPEECMLVWLRRMGSRATVLEIASQTFWASPTRVSSMFNIFADFMHWHLSSPAMRVGVPLERATDFADSIKHRSGTGLDNCVGFLDSKALEIARPGENMEQMAAYNGYYGHHCLRFQAIHSPDGICYDMYGPVEGRRSDGYLLGASDFMCRFLNYERALGFPLCVYADAGYWCSQYVQTGFNKNLGERPQGSAEDDYSKRMNRCRTSVEWGFGLVSLNWPFSTVAAYARVGNCPVGAHYKNAMFMTNVLSCLRGNITSSYFDCYPPSLNAYVNFVKNT